MTTRIQESDDFAFGSEAADVGAIQDFSLEAEVDWDADPAAILERRELENGTNCFDQPIN